MSSPSLQRWLTENLIRRVELVAVETLLRDGPVLPDDLAQIVKARAYVRQLREDPRLQVVRDLYACLRRNPAAVVTLDDSTSIAPRRVWKRVRRHLHVMPSEVFGMLSDHPRVDWVAAHLRAGEMLEEVAESETDTLRMERLYSQAAAFYGAAALWVREQTRSGALTLRDLDPATRRKLSGLGKYAPWLQGRLSAARTTGETEEIDQNADLRRRHEQNTLLMPEFLRQFFQGGASR
jgi:hypothetical protein